MTAEIQHYCRELDRHLNCPKKLRLEFQQETRRMAQDLLQSNPGAAGRDVAAFLGEPAELAQTFQESIDPAALARYRKRRRAGRRIAAAALALVLCGAAVLGWVKWSRYAEYQELFDEVQDADWVIIQHGPYKITEEEYNAARAEANASSSANGG
mgnify:CR=1 FL=1